MFCTNCGKPVNGNFCESCGTPVSNNNNVSEAQNDGAIRVGNLVVCRPDFAMGFAVNIDLYVDGTLYKLGNGQQYIFNLEPRMHVIEYKFWCRRKKTINLNVVTGSNYYIEFEYDVLWGGFKLSKKSKLQ